MVVRQRPSTTRITGAWNVLPANPKPTRPTLSMTGIVHHALSAATSPCALVLNVATSVSPGTLRAHATYADPARWNGHDPRGDRPAPPQRVPGPDHRRDRRQPARARWARSEDCWRGGGFRSHGRHRRDRDRAGRDHRSSTVGQRGGG